jgi:hypothetical protein
MRIFNMFVEFKSDNKIDKILINTNHIIKVRSVRLRDDLTEFYGTSICLVDQGTITVLDNYEDVIKKIRGVNQIRHTGPK